MNIFYCQDTALTKDLAQFFFIFFTLARIIAGGRLIFSQSRVRTEKESCVRAHSAPCARTASPDQIIQYYDIYYIMLQYLLYNTSLSGIQYFNT